MPYQLKGKHGDLEQVTLSSGAVEGVFRPYGSSVVVTRRGREMSVYDLIKLRRQQAIRAAQPRRQSSRRPSNTVQVDVEEHNAMEAARAAPTPAKGGWVTTADGKKCRNAGVTKILAAWGKL